MDKFVLLFYSCCIFQISYQYSKVHPARILEPLNYSVEEFDVVTEDGYILKLFHVSKAGRPKGPVVYLQHGLFGSSVNFCITGHKSLVATLMESNFDVWMGNNRGSFYSTRHINSSVTDRSFWKFSWHEIGYYDIPTFINFILDYTKQPKLHYVGYSHGSTIFFVMTSLRLEFNDKIKSMQALAPAVFMSHVKSPLVRSLGESINILEFKWKFLHLPLVLRRNKIFRMFFRLTCKGRKGIRKICINIFCKLTGCNTKMIEKDVLSQILEISPAPLSVYQIFHYLQEVKSGRFCHYDFGLEENLLIYGEREPPNYNLHKVKVPVKIFASANDMIISLKDVKKLDRYLPNIEQTFVVPERNFGHNDFWLHKKAQELLYKPILYSILEHEDE